jgi:hypothetical protein
MRTLLLALPIGQETEMRIITQTLAASKFWVQELLEHVNQSHYSQKMSQNYAYSTKKPEDPKEI